MTEIPFRYKYKGKEYLCSLMSTIGEDNKYHSIILYNKHPIFKDTLNEALGELEKILKKEMSEKRN